MGSDQRLKKTVSSGISFPTQLITDGSVKQRMLLTYRREPPICSGAKARTNGGAISPARRSRPYCARRTTRNRRRRAHSPALHHAATCYHARKALHQHHRRAAAAHATSSNHHRRHRRRPQSPPQQCRHVRPRWLPMLPTAVSASGPAQLRHSLAFTTLAPSQSASVETTSDLANNDNHSCAASGVEAANENGKDIS